MAKKSQTKLKPAEDETPEQQAERLAAEAAEKEASKKPRTEPKENETDAQRAKRLAEEGTGTNQLEQGYHGSSDNQEPRNFNVDREQQDAGQLQQDRAAQRQSNT